MVAMNSSIALYQLISSWVIKCKWLLLVQRGINNQEYEELLKLLRYLGDKTSYIELDTPSMTTEQVSELEAVLNQKIREGIKVYPTYFEDKNDPRVEEFRTRGLPDDHVGPVRVMTIEGIDSCLCCGTHVSTTADLQLIKLLGAERGKRKNSTNLNFVVGNRVLQYLGRCLEVEKSLTALLKGPLEQHYDLAEKAVKGYKNAQKTTQTLLRDVAVLEAEKYKNNPNRDPVFVCHRKEGDIDFLNTLAREIGNQCDLSFLTAGDDKGSGFLMMTGKENLVQDLAPKVMELMDGKGGCSKGRFQGKVNKLQHRQKAEQLIRNNLGSGDNQAP
ncbi:hypothetical protein CHS0354_033369 [Potamilus streckersoni]|uniref:Threonyl/alanyl tRNA synthetase SAD domain-containing protein n=1 Tax=Potamilus streckersoni TaxID=2493646 RepID=A0AAE0RTH5_9BIVA|nr:hypothetical protein CHS0354_033369 [Potamilus streckersoni]